MCVRACVCGGDCGDDCLCVYACGGGDGLHVYVCGGKIRIQRIFL